jgi:hypothetical protein
MSGTTFSIYSTTNFVMLMKAMAFTKEAIQMNAGASVSVIGTKSLLMPASNAL